MPSLDAVELPGGLRVLTDDRLAERDAIRIVFTERCGGVSVGPYESLDLAGHVGDAAEAVDANRDRVLEALGAGGLRERLTCAEQVHGAESAIVGEAEVGSGAYVTAARGPIPGVDSLLTTLTRVPLALFFADCVPVVLVARHTVRAVAVVHAGWRGAAVGIAADAAHRLAALAGCEPSALFAYVGPHIGACCYEVGPDVAERFASTKGMAAAVSAGGRDPVSGAACFRLDLAAAVSASLVHAGVSREAQCHAGLCTAENTDRFYSYRASGGVTGRHAALALIEPK